MTAWTADEISAIGGSDELDLASLRPDGTLRAFVTMWVVRSGDDLYVRSAYGPDNPWFARALRSGTGRIRAGGLEADVRFEEPATTLADQISAAYHAKYDRFGARMLGTVVSPEAARSTLRLVRR